MRRYLSALFGNDHHRARLGADIERGTLPHAILLVGPEGSGKMTFALQIAAALSCERRTDREAPLPCGTCRACRMVLSQNATDVHLITREEGKATFGIDPVREARADMFLSATEFEKKVYIFKDADLMTVQAQNALLIVLEEPPEGVITLLLAKNEDALLPTIRSRVRTLRMERFDTEQLARYLTERKPAAVTLPTDDRDTLRSVLAGADGCIGQAIRLLQPKETEQLLKEKAVIHGVIDAMATGSFAALCTAFRAFPAKRDELIASLTYLLTAFRDLISCKKAEAVPLCFFTNAERTAEYAQKFRIGRLFGCADATVLAIEQLERNANLQTVLTTLKCAL